MLPSVSVSKWLSLSVECGVFQLEIDPVGNLVGNSEGQGGGEKTI